MPLYDYRCKACDHTQVEKISLADLDTTEVKCKECSEIMERFFGGSDIVFMSPETLGRKKAPGDFRNWLSALKKAHDRPGQSCGIKDH